MNRMPRTVRLATASLAMLLILPGARADFVQFVPFENAQGAPSGLSLTMELIPGSGFVDAVFRNQSTTPAVVTSMFLESSSASASALAGASLLSPDGTGVSYSTGAATPNPRGPVGTFGGTWGGHVLAIRPAAPPVHNGIGPGESLTVRLDLAGAYGEFVQGLNANPPTIRMVQHVQGLEGGGSLWTMNQSMMIIPSPGGTVLALAAAAVFSRRRRVS